MQRYATYRARVFAQLAVATGVDARRLPPAALAVLPDYYRAGLGIDDAADRLAGPGPEPFPRRPLAGEPINDPQEEQ